MNTQKRIAALRREIGYRERELNRIAELRKAAEPTVVAFPAKVDEYLDSIRLGIEVRLNEIRRLELIR